MRKRESEGEGERKRKLYGMANYEEFVVPRADVVIVSGAHSVSKKKNLFDRVIFFFPRKISTDIVD